MKPISSFPDLHAIGAGIPLVAVGQTPGSPGLDSEVDGNWNQEGTVWNLDQDHKQDNKQGHLQKPTVDEESKTLVIPQL